MASGTLAWNGRNTALWQNLNADYHSGVGEQRNVVLADGSQLLLNTDSAVDVRFDQAGRDLRLLRGEIQVNVVAAPALRPFRAQTGQGWVEAAQGVFCCVRSRATADSRYAMASSGCTPNAWPASACRPGNS